MAAASAPLNSALSVDAYSTDGTNYTTLTDSLSMEPSGRTAKILARRVKGVNRVQKRAARLDHGKCKFTGLYSSDIFAIFDAFFVARTPIYLRTTMDDAGVTASKIVCYGPIESLDGPITPGDDEDQKYMLTVDCDLTTFTAGT